jgi:2,3-bisphosphoglycerate-dependent phosphoglycerate mutase
LSDSVTRLVLIRHGAALCHVREVVGGPRGCTGLSEEGLGQAEALRHRLERSGELSEASALFSSVLPRARQTAQAIRPAVGVGGLEVTEDCALCELHPGEADGLTWKEFRDRYGEPDWDTDPERPIAPGGESWTNFVPRVAAALSRLVHFYRGQQVVVVCHGGVVEAAMLAFITRVAGRKRLGLPTDYASITEFQAGAAEGPWLLLRYNDVAHLLG